jgi:glycerol-3-phosphate dehydrogenase
MSYLSKINKKLEKRFGGKVRAAVKDGILTLEGRLEAWEQVVAAGRIAVPTGRRAAGFGGFVNDIRLEGQAPEAPRLPALQDEGLEGARPDVLVIGGGVTGCAIARELSRYSLDVLLIDKEHDLGLHASSRSDGMVHPGLDLHKGSLKHHYNMLGNRMYADLARDLGVPFDRCGQYLCFSRAWMRPLAGLALLYFKYLGIEGVRVVGRRELHRLEPGLGDDMRFAIFAPTAGIVCPFNITIALGENAVENGAKISLDTAALAMEVQDGEITAVRTNRGTVRPAVVVNAAGVYAGDIAAMGGDRFFSIHPRKGTSAILDKKAVPVVTRTIASAFGGSSKHTKGGGLVGTVHGNILVGPDAVETYRKEDFSTERDSIERTFAKHRAASPALSEGQIIAYFSGIRAPTYEEDFVVCKGRKTRNLVHAAGIQSPGLTAAPAIAVDIARYAVEILESRGRRVEANAAFDPRRRPIPHTAAMGEAERAALIRDNPDYGVILCRCEEVSRGEILDALRRPVPCDTLDGVKRRVRPGAGRCQGGFCGPLVLQLIAAQKGIPLSEVTKSGPGSQVLCGPSKGGSHDAD